MEKFEDDNPGLRTVSQAAIHDIVRLVLLARDFPATCLVPDRGLPTSRWRYVLDEQNVDCDITSPTLEYPDFSIRLTRSTENATLNEGDLTLTDKYQFQNRAFSKHHPSYSCSISPAYYGIHGGEELKYIWKPKIPRLEKIWMSPRTRLKEHKQFLDIVEYRSRPLFTQERHEWLRSVLRRTTAAVAPPLVQGLEES